MNTQLAEADPAKEISMGQFDMGYTIDSVTQEESELCILNEAQTQLLTDLVGEFGAKYYQSLSMEDRGTFVDKLAQQYTSLPLRGLSVEAKTVRGDYLCAFLLGMNVDEIALEFEDTPTRVLSYIEKSAQAVTRHIDINNLQYLLTGRQDLSTKTEDISATKDDVASSNVSATEKEIEVASLQGEVNDTSAIENKTVSIKGDESAEVKTADAGIEEPTITEIEMIDSDGDDVAWDSPQSIDSTIGTVEYGTSENNYFSRITNHRLLKPAEEIALAKRIERGDLAAKEKLIDHNYRLVAKIAKAWVRENSFMKFSDLFDEGVIGLIRAAEKFDYRKGYRFTTYATWWITQAIQRSYQDKEATIRIPVPQHERMRRVRKAEEMIIKEHGDIAGREAEIAAIAGITADDLELLRSAFRSVESLDRTISPGEPNSASIGEFTKANDLTVENQVLQSEQHEELIRAIQLLPSKHATIIQAEFGIGVQPSGKEELAELLGTSRVIVSRWRKEALEMLRGIMETGRHMEVQVSGFANEVQTPAEPKNLGSPPSPEDEMYETETTIDREVEITESDPLAILSHREREVLALTDRANCEIALAIGISESTVRTHLRNIRKKLHVESTPQLHILRLSLNTAEGEAAREENPTVKLTPREYELLTEHYDHTYKLAAMSMGLSISSIRTHWHNIFTKLGVQNKIGAMTVGLANGLIDTTNAGSTIHS